MLEQSMSLIDNYNYTTFEKSKTEDKYLLNQMEKLKENFPYIELKNLLLELHSCYYLERTYIFRIVLELSYSKFIICESYSLKDIYSEASLLLNKNPNTIKSDVRFCIQDILNNAPEDLLHSIFYINKNELNNQVNPKYFINRILDYIRIKYYESK